MPAKPTVELDRETAEGDRRPPEFALQHVVEEESRLLHVVEHMMNGLAGVVRQENDIGFGQGPKGDMVEELVEREVLRLSGSSGSSACSKAARAAGSLGGVAQRTTRRQ